MDGAVGAGFAVAQVVALVDDEEAVAAHIGQFADGEADGEHAGAQAVLVAVVFPHRDEVFGADNERFEALVILKDAGDGGGHQGFAETDNVADEDAAAFVEMVGGRS